ncbi:hypothetical protein D8674_038651 [Pyrus ussuriensis x Pyrus communis]|uniref:PB1-like domain-containing protein n=1 Tax=Pyrus ussuriensis x Pyrus communis TaxID=2448454 RepID=A0A5N5I0D6_9ROSA|nr:hypothetical protein D8674_038651 [Pyrus ussuriensis x Pyrus communis]
MANHFRRSGKFTYKIHHGGQIIQKGSQQKYIGGEVIFLDCVSADQQSLVECHDIVKQLGYQLELSMYRKKPTGIGFVEMTCDIEKKKDVGEGLTNVDVSVEQEVEIANKGDVVSFLEDVKGHNREDTNIEGEKNEEVVDEDVFKDSDYEQDSDIELQILDEDANSCDFHSLENETSQEKDEFDEVLIMKVRSIKLVDIIGGHGHGKRKRKRNRKRERHSI